ncbi:hypothetical protein VTL71DRAFT_10019 [Oculimacula yallundae]|uniref:Uncharacterized protein n=1 Tax=Oculimacula yallundae TaxID=86028 RepID=A0ABR4BQ36_9HELO
MERRAKHTTIQAETPYICVYLYIRKTRILTCNYITLHYQVLSHQRTLPARPDTIFDEALNFNIPIPPDSSKTRLSAPPTPPPYAAL